MKHRSHKSAEYLYRIPLVCCFFSTGCLFCWCGISQLFHFIGIPVLILSILSVIFGVDAFISFWISVQNLATCVWMEEKGMSIRRFGKTLYFLPWDGIRFAGPCSDFSYRGKRNLYCFSARRFTPEECSNLTVVDESYISFTYLTTEELHFIRQHCPEKLSDDIDPFVLKQNRNRILAF